MTKDPPATLDEPDTDCEVIGKLRAENERLRRTETCARLVLKAWETAGAATAQPLTDSIVRLRDALAAEQTARKEKQDGQ